MFILFVVRPNMTKTQAKFLTRVVFSAIGILMIQGCSTPDKLDFRTCPQVVILGDAAKVNRLNRSGSKDIADTLYQARLGNIRGGCKYYDESVDVEFSVDLLAQAGAAFTPNRPYQEEYFIAILDPAGNRLSKKNFVAELPFKDGETNAISTETLTQSIPLTPDTDAAGYMIYVGLQLTPDELAINRAQNNSNR